MDTNLHYNICVKGHPDPRWLSLFEGLAIIQMPNDETNISGAMDQSALYGVLNRIRDLGLELISVQRASVQTEHEQERKK